MFGQLESKDNQRLKDNGVSLLESGSTFTAVGFLLWREKCVGVFCNSAWNISKGGWSGGGGGGGF